MENNLDLSQLRGLHMPLEPDFFPLAVGWWIALIAFIVVLIASISLAFHFWFAPKRQALHELEQLRLEYAQKNVIFAKEVSKLLKRVAILKWGRDEVANLSGPQWSAFLLEKGNKTLTFNQANLIAYSTYLPPSSVEPISVKELNQATVKWIKHVLKEK